MALKSISSNVSVLTNEEKAVLKLESYYFVCQHTTYQSSVLKDIFIHHHSPDEGYIRKFPWKKVLQIHVSLRIRHLS